MSGSAKEGCPQSAVEGGAKGSRRTGDPHGSSGAREPESRLPNRVGDRQRQLDETSRVGRRNAGVPQHAGHGVSICPWRARLGALSRRTRPLGCPRVGRVHETGVRLAEPDLAEDALHVLSSLTTCSRSVEPPRFSGTSRRSHRRDTLGADDELQALPVEVGRPSWISCAGESAGRSGRGGWSQRSSAGSTRPSSESSFGILRARGRVDVGLGAFDESAWRARRGLREVVDGLGVEVAQEDVGQRGRCVDGELACSALPRRRRRSRRG